MRGGADPESVPEADLRTIEQLETLIEAAERLRESDGLHEDARVFETRHDRQGEVDALGQYILAVESAEAAELAAWKGAMEGGEGEPWPPKERAQGLAEAVRARLGELADKIAAGGANPSLQPRVDDVTSRLATFDRC